jgi:hypothetical protein
MGEAAPGSERDGRGTDLPTFSNSASALGQRNGQLTKMAAVQNSHAENTERTISWWV